MFNLRTGLYSQQSALTSFTSRQHFLDAASWRPFNKFRLCCCCEMALHSKKGSYGIPKDAVQLTRDDAIAFMQDILINWEPPKDVFFFKYGAGLLGGLAAAGGIYLNSYYRNRLRLLHYAKMTTYLPSAIIPATFAFITHVKKVQEPITIGEMKCSVCAEIRATTSQMICGVFYPALITPLSGFMVAVRYNTYNVPHISKDPKSVWLLFLKLTRPISRTLAVMAGINIAAAAYITYKETESVAKVSGKLMQIEAQAQGLLAN